MRIVSFPSAAGFTVEIAFVRDSNPLEMWDGVSAWTLVSTYHAMSFGTIDNNYYITDSDIVPPDERCWTIARGQIGAGPFTNIDSRLFDPYTADAPMSIDALYNLLIAGALNPVTFHVTDDQGVPQVVPGLTLEIWDLGGVLRYKKGITDSNGDWVTGGLPEGDYTIRGFSPTHSFTEQPITIPVGGGTIPLSAVRTVFAPGSSPGLTTLWGYTADILGVAIENTLIEILTYAPVAVFSGGSAIDGDKHLIYTDASGYFSVGVVQEIPIRIKCQAVKYNRSITFADTVADMDWQDIPINNDTHASYN